MDENAEVVETSPAEDLLDSQEVETNEQEVEQDVIDGDSEASEKEQADESDDDSEELEFNQQSYKLPKTIAAAVRDMQKDYTVKTQEVAEQRKTFEAQARFQIENIDQMAEVKALDKQIQQYKNLDWSTLNQQDPVMFQQLRLQYDEVREARQNVAGQLAQKHQTETLQNQQEIAKKMQESDVVLRRDIRDWSPVKEQSLQEFAVKQYGLNLEEVRNAKVNPALYKLLNDAFIGQSLLKKQTTKPVAAPKKVEPVPIISGRKSTAVTKDPTKMTDDEYAKYRAAQIKKRHA